MQKTEIDISELKFRRLFETAQDGILLLDFKTGRITDVNKFLSNLLGYSKDNLLHKYLWEIGFFKDEKAQKDNFKTLQEKKYVRFEDLPLETKNGKRINVEFVANAYDVGGEMVIQCNVRDITDRVIVEKTLQKTEKKYRDIFNISIDSLMLLDENGFIDCNPAALKMFGYKTVKELCAKHPHEVSPPVQPSGMLSKTAEKIQINQAYKHGSTSFEWMHRRKNGQDFPASVLLVSFDQDGRKILQATVRDITEQKNTQILLQNSEEKYSKAFINSPQAIIVTRVKDSTVIELNATIIRMTGYSRSELINNSLLSLKIWLNPSDRDDYVSALKSQKSITNREYLFRTKKGKIFVGLISARMLTIGNELCILANIADITKSKLAEIKLRESEFFFKESQRVANIGSYKFDITANTWTSSNVLNKILGIDPSYKKTLESWLSLVHPDDQKMMNNYFKKEVIGKHLRFAKEYRVIRKNDAETRWVSGLGKVSYGHNGNPISMYGTIMDITEHTEIENKILELKDRNESIMACIGDAVMAVDKRGEIIVFNKVAEEMTGTEAKLAIGQHYNKIVTFIREKDRKRCPDFVEEAIKYNKITEMANHALLLRADGIEIPVADSAAPVKNRNGETLGCVVVFRDMTRERKIDKAKTEFVSLASHQLRTPLSTINWYSEVLLSEDIGKLTQKQKQYSQEVYHASQRMVSLVNALLNVSRLELGTFAVEPKMVNLIKIAKTCIKEMLPYIHAKKISLTEEYSRDIVMIRVDPKLMGIIFQNLLSNSVKYSKNGSEVILEITKKDDNLLIAVSDKGIGIPTDQKKDIFKKMFRADNAKTTDPDGTGLGLYIVKEIIDYIGGKVWFESIEGKGTKFYASLPMSGMKKKISNKKLI